MKDTHALGLLARLALAIIGGVAFAGAIGVVLFFIFVIMLNIRGEVANFHQPMLACQFFLPFALPPFFIMGFAIGLLHDIENRRNQYLLMALVFVGSSIFAFLYYNNLRSYDGGITPLGAIIFGALLSWISISVIRDQRESDKNLEPDPDEE